MVSQEKGEGQLQPRNVSSTKVLRNGNFDTGSNVRFFHWHINSGLDLRGSRVGREPCLVPLAPVFRTVRTVEKFPCRARLRYFRVGKERRCPGRETHIKNWQLPLRHQGRSPNPEWSTKMCGKVSDTTTPLNIGRPSQMPLRELPVFDVGFTVGAATFFPDSKVGRSRGKFIFAGVILFFRPPKHFLAVTDLRPLMFSPASSRVCFPSEFCYEIGPKIFYCNPN